MVKRILLSAVGIGLALFLVLQLIPANRTNPPVTREVNWDSPQTRQIAQRACFDCHSNETIWPWYANMAPVKLILANHVNEGREKLNFSSWDQPQHDADDVGEVIEEGEMPLWDYLMMHPEAKLTNTEKQQLITGLQATFAQDPPVEGETDQPGKEDD